MKRLAALMTTLLVLLPAVAHAGKRIEDRARGDPSAEGKRPRRHHPGRLRALRLRHPLRGDDALGRAAARPAERPLLILNVERRQPQRSRVPAAGRDPVPGQALRGRRADREGAGRGAGPHMVLPLRPRSGPRRPRTLRLGGADPHRGGRGRGARGRLRQGRRLDHYAAIAR